MILAPDLVQLLNEKALQFSHRDYIRFDPIALPHQFENQEDIEIAAFIVATISWGQRPMILRNGERLLSMMEGGPHHFLLKAGEDDFSRFLPFVHRTFNGWDAILFLKALQSLYRKFPTMQVMLEEFYREEGQIKSTIIRFREAFFEGLVPGRSGKHFSDVSRNSAGKRINMFLRWMVRKDRNGFDFGLWSCIPASALMIPLDLHSGGVARALGLLTRKQDDWKAVEELTDVLRYLDPEDPVKYDFALFGLGAYDKITRDGQ